MLRGLGQADRQNDWRELDKICRGTSSMPLTGPGSDRPGAHSIVKLPHQAALATLSKYFLHHCMSLHPEDAQDSHEDLLSEHQQNDRMRLQVS